MNLKNFFSNKRRFILVGPLITVFAILCYILIFIMNFPKELHLMEGNNSEIVLSFPFTLNRNEDYIAVSNNDDKKVENNIVIDSDENISTGEDMQLSLLGFNLKKVSVDILPDVEVIPCGVTVGVKIYSDGVMVLGTGSVSSNDNNIYRPAENILKSGDLILEIDGDEIKDKNDLMQKIEESSGDELELKVKRSEEILNLAIKPVISAEDGEKKIGVWVRDSTQGIGTLTYYNPKSKVFGALGHGIMDVDTKKLISVKKGTLMSSEIVSVKKGKKGNPGELEGEIQSKNILGDIQLNTTHGIYGYVNDYEATLPNKSVKVGLQNEIHEGPAKIISNISGSSVKEYDIYIESVNRYSSDDSKGMIIKITDKELITKTNGIVQGMSGSPILQDGKLIGAITHVFVQNPTKGYGIFIENMMKNEKDM